MKKLVIYLLLLFFTIELNANIPTVDAKVDTINGLIGDQIKLILSAKSKKITKFQFPELINLLNGLEIISQSKIDTIQNDTIFKLTQQYILTAFDSGYYQIPSLTFTYLLDNFADTLFTKPIFLTFNSLDIDTTKDIKDIKPPLEVSANWLETFLYVFIGLIIVIIGYLAYKYFIKKQSIMKDKDKNYDESLPADKEALKRLKELEEKKLWQSGFHKEYFTELTDIIRTYMERQLNIDALEMTSSEILIALKTKRLNEEIIKNMQYLFENADLSKFAKYKPLPEININSLKYSYDFIEYTRPTENSNKTHSDQNDAEVKGNE